MPDTEQLFTVYQISRQAIRFCILVATDNHYYNHRLRQNIVHRKAVLSFNSGNSTVTSDLAVFVIQLKSKESIWIFIRYILVISSVNFLSLYHYVHLKMQVIFIFFNIARICRQLNHHPKSWFLFLFLYVIGVTNISSSIRCADNFFWHCKISLFYNVDKAYEPSVIQIVRYMYLRSCWLLRPASAHRLYQPIFSCIAF